MTCVIAIEKTCVLLKATFRGGFFVEKVINIKQQTTVDCGRF